MSNEISHEGKTYILKSQVESIIKVSEVEIEPEIEKDMYEEKPKSKRKTNGRSNGYWN